MGEGVESWWVTTMLEGKVVEEKKLEGAVARERKMRGKEQE
jgi:hypothetical protein